MALYGDARPSAGSQVIDLNGVPKGIRTPVTAVKGLGVPRETNNLEHPCAVSVLISGSFEGPRRYLSLSMFKGGTPTTESTAEKI